MYKLYKIFGVRVRHLKCTSIYFCWRVNLLSFKTSKWLSGYIIFFQRNDESNERLIRKHSVLLYSIVFVTRSLLVCQIDYTIICIKYLIPSTNHKGLT